MNEQQIRLKRTYALRFAFAGIGFGLLFPILATLIELSTNQIPFTITSVWHLLSTDPLLLIIDTAPFFLGLFAYLAGTRQDTLIHSNEELHRRDLELKSIQTSVEQRIQEQTGDLSRNAKKLERRAAQLEAVSSVARSITAVQNMEQLLPSICQVVSERFGFYHTGIFLLDAHREYAVLRASNSPGGQHMLTRGHRLKVGEVGIVGYVCGKGEARIALDVGQDAVFFNNPDLPETHSEIALPLIMGGKVLGALDVQSTKEMAFADEDISTLSVLADQIAIAIENARLFASTQTALEAASRAYGDISRLGWQHLLSERETEIGYVSLAESDTLPVSEQASPEFLKAIKSGQAVLANENASLHLPIKTRGSVVGAIRLDKQKGEKWSVDDISTANTLSEQLGAALESARLFEETSNRAARERTVSDISTKIRATTDPQTMLVTTIEELKKVLGTNDIQIRPYADQPAEERDARKKKARKIAK